MTTTPNNNYEYRLREVERRLANIESGQPAVVADRVARLEQDLRAFRDEHHEDNAAMRRLLLGVGVTVLTSSIGIAATLTLLTGGP